jgi:hypothetical protein
MPSLRGCHQLVPPELLLRLRHSRAYMLGSRPGALREQPCLQPFFAGQACMGAVTHFEAIDGPRSLSTQLWRAALVACASSRRLPQEHEGQELCRLAVINGRVVRPLGRWPCALGCRTAPKQQGSALEWSPHAARVRPVEQVMLSLIRALHCQSEAP